MEKKKGSYKKWSKEERAFSYNLTMAAAKLGWIKDRTACERCTQDRGIIHLHNEDYDVTLEVLQVALLDRDPPNISEDEKKRVNDALEVLCWRCHMIHHSAHRNPVACERYWAEVKAGKIYPAVYKHNFSVLRENGL